MVCLDMAVCLVFVFSNVFTENCISGPASNAAESFLTKQTG